jgi:response regulator RpfG family c-di-GMP phosphodiesterase
MNFSNYVILCVDDEPNIHSALRRIFDLAGLSVQVASSAAEALKLLAENEFHVVLTDMHMPEMSGTDFLAQVRSRWPKIIRLMLTGTTDSSTAINAINQGEIYRYLSKPWDNDEVVSVVREAIEKYALIEERDKLVEITKQQNLKLANMVNTLEEKVQERTAELTQSLAELRGSYVASIKAYSKLIVLRSKSLFVHSQAVADLSVKIARLANCSQSEVQDIYIAGLLHDLGKIGLPETMLINFNAEGDEYLHKMYESHPKSGENCLIGLYEMDQIASYICMHHERFDGSGFPKGLKGVDTPFGARVLSAVEAYEELKTSLTGTEKMLPRDAALMIFKHSGSHFCPEVCHLLLKALGIDIPEQTSLQSINKLSDASEKANDLANATVEANIKRPEVLIRNLLTYAELLAEVAKYPGAGVVDERDKPKGYLWVKQAGGVHNANPKLLKWLKDHRFLVKEEKGWFLPLL